MMAEMTEAEARYIQRLPGQLEASLRKTQSLLAAHKRYGMGLEAEAQLLLQSLYGSVDPGFEAEIEYQTFVKRQAQQKREQKP